MTILSYGSMISKNSGELKLCRTYIAHSIICIIITDVFVCDCNHPKRCAVAAGRSDVSVHEIGKCRFCVFDKAERIPCERDAPTHSCLVHFFTSQTFPMK